MIKFITLGILRVFDYFYQKKMINFIKKKIQKINVFLDVGAHKGETIELFSKNFEINRLYSFEASPLTFKILQERLNKIKRKYNKTQIFLENLALGSENKKIYIKHLNESSSSTIKSINSDSKYFKKKFFFLNNSKKKNFYKEIEVEQILLDEFVKKNSISKIDFIKIDTEGYELEVLKGSKNILDNTNFLLFEHHYDDMIVKNYFFSDIHEFLLKNNFKKIYKSKMPFRKTFEYIYINKNYEKID